MASGDRRGLDLRRGQYRLDRGRNPGPRGAGLASGAWPGGAPGQDRWVDPSRWSLAGGDGGMIAAAAPSPLWFASRGSGTATLLLLTGVVALGILTAGSAARSRVWPRFVSAELHRNVSLFAVAFLLAHVATA